MAREDKDEGTLGTERQRTRDADTMKEGRDLGRAERVRGLKSERGYLICKTEPETKMYGLHQTTIGQQLKQLTVLRAGTLVDLPSVMITAICLASISILPWLSDISMRRAMALPVSVPERAKEID